MDEFYNGSPLDEIQWSMPQAVEFYGGIRAENIHLYFMASPFCDPTSNNKVLEVQFGRNPATHSIMTSRAQFEARLRDMNGIEYMIVDGPAETTPEMNPVWVIRKQRRSKSRGSADHVDILGTYYAIGENIYQAPSLFDVLSCRLVSRARLNTMMVACR